MKELLKKASLTVASACLIAGGLASVGFAAGQDGTTERFAERAHLSISANEKQQAMPDELEVNGQKYKKIVFDGCGRWPAICTCLINPQSHHCGP